jgi:hypothetical protein
MALTPGEEGHIMAFPIAIPLAISAIKALLKFRGQVDVIPSLKEASAALLFALPEAPPDNVTQDELAQQVIAATLSEVGQNLPLLTSDPKAF